jgi:hypothetical protein
MELTKMHRSDPTAWLTRALLLAVIVSISAACGGDREPAVEEQQAEQAPAMIERDAPGDASSATASQPEPDEEFRVVPQLDGKLEQDGMGLETIINADSRRAYTESLRWISEDVSARQYRNLERSIQYILAYDPAVLGSEERMLEVVDGLTGQEVIERAQRLMQRRGG